MRRMESLHGGWPVVVLKIIVRRGPLHGYALTTQIEGMSDLILRVEEGSLYPALYRMEENGWIRPKWVTTENKKRARIYEITAAGKRHLEAAGQRRQSATAAGPHLCQPP